MGITERLYNSERVVKRLDSGDVHLTALGLFANVLTLGNLGQRVRRNNQERAARFFRDALEGILESETDLGYGGAYPYEAAPWDNPNPRRGKPGSMPQYLDY